MSIRVSVPSALRAATCCLAMGLALPALASDRDVQFSSVDMAANVVTMTNFGTTTVDMTGWRFCTHDFNEARRYSASGGLNGVMLAPGASLTFHYNNDAPVSPSAFNISDLGGSFAQPLNPAAYSLQMFTNSSFNSTTTLSDHVQWAVDPGNIGSAGFRSTQAVNAGVWTVAADYVVTTATSELIVLTDESGAELHGPANYAVDPVECLPDTNGDGILDNGDIGTFVQLFLASDPAADFNNDGILDNGDIGSFVALFLAGCSS